MTPLPNPTDEARAKLAAIRQRSVQAIGAGLSLRNWHATEAAYNELRDRLDELLREPALLSPTASAVPPVGKCDSCNGFGYKLNVLHIHGERDEHFPPTTCKTCNGTGLAAASPEPQPAPSAAGGWRPIDTAPRGRKVLAGCYNRLGKWRTMKACYYLAGTLEAGEDLPDDLVDENGYAPEGWYEESETHDTILPCFPTHWQPLPLPPDPPAAIPPGNGA